MLPLSIDQNTSKSTFIFKSHIDPNMHIEIVESINETQILLKGVLADSLFEYAEDKMIIAMDPCDLLLIDNFRKVRIVQDLNFNNSRKYWICPMPDFDLIKFPFLVCSGSQTFNIINTMTGGMEALV